ncbi:MAG TPA: universal stress protein [Streptosporangiaceae bacterium]|nr:universal stress protein [Streptosporangiaceae bacterium]
MNASSGLRVPRRWSRPRTTALEELLRESSPPQQRRPERQARPERDSHRGTEPVHPVIVGYDGSASARNALAYAAGTAKQLGRPLLVAYVVRNPPSTTGRIASPPDDNEALERWLLSELEQVTDPGDLDVHVRTRHGNPPRELAALAAELRAEALVIGVPGRFWHHAAGSVPGWLARHPRCPVIVVP